jgi:hypothetical protein
MPHSTAQSYNKPDDSRDGVTEPGECGKGDSLFDTRLTSISAKMGRLTAAKRNAAKTPAQSALASARRIRAPTWRHALAPTARLTLAVTPTMRKLKITTAEFVVAAI